MGAGPHRPALEGEWESPSASCAVKNPRLPVSGGGKSPLHVTACGPGRQEAAAQPQRGPGAWAPCPTWAQHPEAFSGGLHISKPHTLTAWPPPHPPWQLCTNPRRPRGAKSETQEQLDILKPGCRTGCVPTGCTAAALTLSSMAQDVGPSGGHEGWMRSWDGVPMQDWYPYEEGHGPESPLSFLLSHAPTKKTSCERSPR